MKKIISAFLAVIMLAAIVPMSAVAVTENGYTFNVSYGEATITEVDETVTGDVVIPDTLDGCKVVAIGDGVFGERHDITSVVIPEGVRSLGKQAFWYCTNIVSVTIPSTLKSVGKTAFQLCDDIENVYITDLSAWCNIKFEGEGANPLCHGRGILYLSGEAATDLVIPEDVTDIGAYTFAGYNPLKSVTFHSGVVTIGAGAFYNCDGLTEITLPEGVVNVGESAFGSCSNLAKFTVSSTVRSFGHNCFYGASIDETYITDIAAWCGIEFAPNGHPLMNGGKLFLNGAELTTLVIPEGVTVIKACAFENASSINSIFIPQSVTEIDNGAFSGVKANVVYIDSADVASSIFYYNGAGYLTNGSKSVNVRSDIETTHNYITETYTFTETITYNGSEYTSYSDHAHEWTDLNAEPKECKYDGFAGKRCTVCGTLSGENVTCHFETEIRDAVEATKESEGYTGNIHCANCGVKLALGEVIPKLHTPGDVDDNGKINLGDVSLLLKYIAKWDVSINLQAGDVTADGKVNLGDVSLILKYIAKWDVVLK